MSTLPFRGGPTSLSAPVEDLLAKHRGRRAVVSARGHPALRPTHAKTLEFTCEHAITARATCVVGIGTDFDPVALGLLRGRVRLVVAAAGFEASGEAIIHPGHRISDRLVIRRSDFMDDATLAVRATMTAEDLGSDLTAVLVDPDTTVTLSVEEMAPPATLLLLHQAGAPIRSSRLELLWDNADVVVDLTSARSAIDVPVTEASLVAVRVPGPLDELQAGVTDWVLNSVKRGARVAVMDPGGGPVEALLAAGLPPTPVLWMGAADRSAMLNMPRRSPVPTALRLSAAAATALCEMLATTAPGLRVAVPDGTLDVGTSMMWGGQVRASADEPVIVVVDSAGFRESVDLEAVVLALAAVGIAPRTLSEALLPIGVSRRRVYDITGDRSATPGTG